MPNRTMQSILFFIVALILNFSIEASEVKLAYHLSGTGKPLVMINELNAPLSSWDPELLSLLENHYQIILIDTVFNQTTPSQMAGEIASLIKSLGFDHVNILGWSSGILLVQQLTISYPELVTKQILCASNPDIRYELKANLKDLPTITTPTLLVSGIDDFARSPDDVHSMANRIPMAWSAYFQRDQESPHHQYDRFVDLVTLFLE